ncbi:hypothetical protein F4561_004903 [Lipingzhangella halophila]|uniref:Protein kinase domain-containing protein n=2 Tax=Lipingzhangella halophila TaxID=1783352 RepID=A0A7W7RLA3_9ACTN|nr:hypothetical protein [Lipingzhangella halophila]
MDSPVPDGWERKVGAEWVVMRPDNWSGPRQGWKIHLSATLENAPEILDTVWEYCMSHPVMFKFIRSTGVLARRNGKYGDRGSSGKFISLFPPNDADLEKLLHDLDGLLSGNDGPYILSDLRWRSGPLYVRYGGFDMMMGVDTSGEMVPCIVNPQGELVPDHRGPSFRVPDWVDIPGFLDEAHKARRAQNLSDFPFTVYRALHFSNGGGVYRATASETGEDVILKEARPFSGIDASNEDAVERIRREKWALEVLDGMPGIPRVERFIRGHEHYFLVREFVAGRPLNARIQEKNPLLTGDGHASGQACAEYARWGLSILEQVRSGISGMHERGVVFGDLQPRNILVDDDDTVGFIDFEAISSVADASPQSLGTPGYAAPQGYTGTDIDWYAFGCLCLAVFAPVTTLVPWGEDKVRALLELVEKSFDLPEDFAAEVRRHLGRDHAAAVPFADPEWKPDGVSGPSPTRDRIIGEIVAGAAPEREDRLHPGDIAQFLRPGGGVAFGSGALGVLWAARQADAPLPGAHLEWTLERLEHLERTSALESMGPGLFHGSAGISYALRTLGRGAEADRVLERALEAPRGTELGIADGLSGIGLELLHRSCRSDEDTHAAQARRVAEDVVEALHLSPVDRRKRGLLHGRCGAALFLVRCYERFRDPAMLQEAGEALHSELSAVGWAPESGRFDPSAHVRRTHGLSGMPGIGVALHAYLRHVDEPPLRTALDDCRETMESPIVACAGLEHGRAGTILALSRVTGGTAEEIPALLRHGDALGWYAISTDDGRLGFLGAHNLRLSADLLTGSAGVLAALRALSHGPDSFPVLDPQEPCG